jgi:hypothetical protein
MRDARGVVIELAVGISIMRVVWRLLFATSFTISGRFDQAD